MKASINIHLVITGLVKSVEEEYGIGIDNHIVSTPVTHPFTQVGHTANVCCCREGTKNKPHDEVQIAPSFLNSVQS